MQIVEPIDIEDALRQTLTRLSGIKCYATPLPPSYDEDMPCALIQQIGGARRSVVVDEHDVTISVYAASYAEADSVARRLAAIISALSTYDGTYCYTEISSLPYDDPDPLHTSTYRVSFTAAVTCRGEVSDL